MMKLNPDYQQTTELQLAMTFVRWKQCQVS